MFRRLLAILVLTSVSGCGLISQIFGGNAGETGAAKLTPFGSEQELREYFSDQMRARNAAGGAARGGRAKTTWALGSER